MSAVPYNTIQYHIVDIIAHSVMVSIVLYNDSRAPLVLAGDPVYSTCNFAVSVFNIKIYVTKLTMTKTKSSSATDIYIAEKLMNGEILVLVRPLQEIPLGFMYNTVE